MLFLLVKTEIRMDTLFLQQLHYNTWFLFLS